MCLQQARDVGLIHLWRRRRDGPLICLARRQRRNLIGILLRDALGFLDLALGFFNGLTLGLLELLPRRFRALLCKIRLRSGVFQLLPGLIGGRLSGRGRLACRRFLGSLDRLLLGLASCVVGRDLSLLRSSQLIELSARQVRIESVGMAGEE
jgi:hypothetical protein